MENIPQRGQGINQIVYDSKFEVFSLLNFFKNYIKLTVQIKLNENSIIDKDLKKAEKISKTISDGSSLETIKDSWLNKKILRRNPKLFFYLNKLLDDSQKEALHNTIFLSTGSTEIDIASSNSITILNKCKYSFIENDLKYVRIPYADLTDSLFYKVDLTKSYLKGVDFTRAQLINTNFQRACLEDVNFGYFPLIDHEYNKDSIAGWPYKEVITFINKEKSIVLGDLQVKKKISILGSVKNVKTAVFSKCGKYLALITCENVISVGNVKNGDLVGKNENKTKIGISISMSNDGMICFIDMHNINIGDIRRDQILYLKNNTSELLEKVEYSSSCKYLACKGKNKLRIYHTANEFKKVLKINEKLSILCGSNREEYLATYFMKDETVRIYNLINKECIILYKNKNYPLSMAGNNNLLVIEIWDSIDIGDIESQKLLYRIANFSTNRCSSYFSSCGNYLAIGSNNAKQIEIFNTNCLSSIFQHYESINSVLFSPCSNFFLTVCNYQKIKIFLLESMQNIITIHVTNSEKKLPIAGSPCSNYIAFISDNIMINISKRENQILFRLVNSFTILNLSWAPSGKFLAFGGYSKFENFCIGNLETQQKTTQTNDGIDLTYSLAGSHDEQFIALSNSEQSVSILDQRNSRKDFILNASNMDCSIVAWSYSNEYLAAATKNHQILIGSMKTRFLVYGGSYHSEDINNLIGSSCGRYLCSAGSDRKINFLHIKLEKIVYCIENAGNVNIVSGARNGNYLLSASEFTYKLWKIIIDDNEIHCELISSSKCPRLIELNCDFSQADLSYYIQADKVYLEAHKGNLCEKCNKHAEACICLRFDLINKNPI